MTIACHQIDLIDSGEVPDEIAEIPASSVIYLTILFICLSAEQSLNH